MEISLGPLLFFWSRQDVFAFYEQAMDSVFDCIYLGEVVCSKRRELRFDDWMEIAGKLQSAGKQVVLSSMTLIESESDLAQVKRVCENGQFMVEANDMAAVHLLSSLNLPFYTGPSVNIYNGYTLKILWELGLKRWVLPVELSSQNLQAILSQAQELGITNLETEVFSYGYMPLAYSARCFTARTEGLAKDQCEFTCMKTPQGIPMATQEGEQLFTINGIQTMSGQCMNLLSEKKAMEDLGISSMRFSAHSSDIFDMARDFVNSQMNKSDIDGTAICNGYWQGKAGVRFMNPDAAEADL